MGIQTHHPRWEIHIVVIPCRLVKHLQATISSFVFILIIKTLELDSNWNTKQQVRIYLKYYAIKVLPNIRYHNPLLIINLS